MTTKTPLPSLSDLLHWPPGQAPYAKQEEAHGLSANERVFALLAEQRTGKTPITLGTAAWQYRRFLDAGGFGDPGKAVQPGPTVYDLLPKKFVHRKEGSKREPRIDDLPKKPTQSGLCYRPRHWAARGLDAMFVVALPSGVPANWEDEIKSRLPASMNATTMVWNARKADGAEYAARFKALLAHEGFACLLMNGEAIPTPTAKKAIGTFLRTRRALAVGDETSLICAEPGNVRSRVMDAIRKLPGAVCRRILDGTPADESPLHLFSQFGFLDPKILGFDSWVAFKKYYAEYEEQTVWVKGKERKFQAITVDEETGKKKYRNLDEMGRRLAPVSFRVRRSDVFDIPDKVRVPYHFDLSDAQRSVYDPLREEFEAWLADGQHVTAKNVLARMTRLDQVRANYYPGTIIPAICADCDGDGCAACDDVGAILSKTPKKVIDAKRNSLIDAVDDVLALNHGDPGIAWCAFDETVDAVMVLANAKGLNPLRYDGAVDDEIKALNKRLFQGGQCGLLVAKEASAGRGINLSAAKWMVYVENGYSKRRRSQSEDRAEVAGRTFGTGVYDLIASDTYDSKKLEAHFAKGEVSEMLWAAIADGSK